MPNIILPSRRIAQPQGAADLANYWRDRQIVHAISGDFDYATRKQLTFNGTSLQAGKQGRGIIASAQSSIGASTPNNILSNSPLGKGKGDFTALLYVDDITLTSNRAMACLVGCNDIGENYVPDAQRELYFVINANAGLSTVAGACTSVRNNWAGSSSSRIDGVVAVGKPLLMGIRRYGYTISDIANKTIVNYVVDSVYASQRINDDSAKANIHIGGWWNTNWGAYYSKQYLFIAFDVALSDTEIFELSDNPWQVFAPQKRVVYFDVGAGGGSQSLTPSLYTNTNTFYAHTVTTGAVTLTPSLFTNSNTFYSHTLTSGITLTPALYTNSNTFNQHTVAPGAVTLIPALYSNSSTFYAHSVTTGSVTLAPSLYENSNTFYSAIVSTGGSVLQPSLYENSNTFYSATVTTGAVTLSPSLYSNTNSVYSHTVSTGSVTLAPSLYTNTSDFYGPTVTRGSVTLAPSLYSNENTFYAHVLEQQGGTKYLVQSATFANTNAFYNATITTGAVTLAPSLVTNNSTIYSHALSARYNLLPSIVTNGSIFYSPTVTTSAPVLRPSLFTNSNTFYTHVVSRVGEVPLDVLQFQLYMNQDINFTLAINGSKSFALEI